MEWSKVRGVAGRVLYGALACAEGVIGAWAAIAPRSFYRSFPGGGWHWVAASGPFDEHLVRDFGGLSLALAVLSASTALWPARRALVTAVAAWELVAVPHLAYHAAHLGQLPAVQDAASVGSLVAAVVVPLVAGALLWGPADAGGAAPLRRGA